MSVNNYTNFHRKRVEEKDTNEYDMISWEAVDPGNRYQSITYTRFLTKPVKDGSLLLSPVKCLYWNLDTAKTWFIDQKQQKDPETNEPIFSSSTFCKRLEQQLALKSYENENKENIEKIPEMDYIKDIFLKWKNDRKSITEKEECLLQNFFHIDNTILSGWQKSHGMELRTLANDLITNAENGSWLIRHSSVEDSDMMKARVITSKSNTGEICHTIIAVIYGFGYVTPNVERGQKLPSLGSGEYIKISRYIAPSFIQLITDLAEMCDFNISKLIM